MNGGPRDELKSVVEVVLLAAERPVSVDELVSLIGTESGMTVAELRDSLRRALGELMEACKGRGLELREVSSGYRYQVRTDYSRWVARFLGERPPRYSRAVLETLALIAYRQPITRGEIEEVRGVRIAASTMRALHEREWIRVLAHREVPGRPALYGTTRAFLDDFGLASLEELPALEDIRGTVPADLFAADDAGATDAITAQGIGFDESETAGPIESGALRAAEGGSAESSGELGTDGDDAGA